MGAGACRITALVPNVRGAEAALAAGVDELTATIAASPVYNERNVIAPSRNRSPRSAESVNWRIMAASVDVVISCAFAHRTKGHRCAVVARW